MPGRWLPMPTFRPRSIFFPKRRIFFPTTSTSTAGRTSGLTWRACKISPKTAPWCWGSSAWTPSGMPRRSRRICSNCIGTRCSGAGWPAPFSFPGPMSGSPTGSTWKIGPLAWFGRIVHRNFLTGGWPPRPWRRVPRLPTSFRSQGFPRSPWWSAVITARPRSGAPSMPCKN